MAKAVFFIALILAGGAAAAHREPVPRSQPVSQGKAWTPEAITWQEVNADGTKYAVLEGRRDIPGEAFTYAFFIPGGLWDAPHSHTADARVVVVKGRLKLGYGRVLDKQSARDFPVGSYLLVPANADHFDGADEDTIIIGTAVGPWKTTYVR